MKKKLQDYIFKHRILTLFVVFVLIIAALVVAMVITKQTTVSEAEAVTFSTSKPSEVKPDDNFVWRGKPGEPKKITIDSISVNAFIQRVGVDQNREVAVPSNIHFAGWFVDSQLPGEQGLSIIDGHVDGVTQNTGVFADLPNMKQGDIIEVELGNGERKRFKTLSVSTVGVDNAAQLLFSQDPRVQNQLNLITCIGAYDKNTGRYDQRVIVTAEQV